MSETHNEKHAVALDEGGEVSDWERRYGQLAEAYATSEAMTRAVQVSVVHTVGGTVEGAPTSTINYLQRIRALVATEARVAELEKQRDLAQDSGETWKQRCEDAMAERDMYKADADNLRRVLEVKG